MGLTRRWWGVVAMLLAPLALLVVLRVASHLDPAFFSPHGHLVAVGGIAAMAMIVGVAAAVAARGSGHPGLVYLGCGAAGLGILMLGHGLVTPGVHGHHDNAWVSRLPYAAIAVFAIGLFLGGRAVDSRVSRFVRAHSGAVLGGVLIVLAAGTAFVVADSTVMPVATWEETFFDAVSVAIVVLCLVVVATHWRRWQLGQDSVQLALAFSAAMTIASVIALQHGKFPRVSWWDYHTYLLVGFGAAVYAIASRTRTSRAVSDILGNAFVDDPFEHIVHGYPDALRQLVRAVEIKDAYTHGHSERTARVATELGLRMGLPASTVRVIARGAYLHDLGKIGIPDEILNKPGRLTQDEREVIETHPQLGYEIASGATGLEETLGVILHHHERYDGGGYPLGLTGKDVPIEARVVTVADVWDALTSDRAYRKGWSASDALAHIEAGRGTHFDPRVVDAMVDLAAEWGITATPEAGEPEEAWAAAQTCHQVVPDSELVGA
jgi:HD-GYP domain-containing protein (c-di-GMP phosphodiesterase class II)